MSIPPLPVIGPAGFIPGSILVPNLEISRVPIPPLLHVPKLPNMLAFWPGTNLLLGAIFTRGKTCLADCAAHIEMVPHGKGFVNNPTKLSLVRHTLHAARCTLNAILLKDKMYSDINSICVACSS